MTKDGTCFIQIHKQSKQYSKQEMHLNKKHIDSARKNHLSFFGELDRIGERGVQRSRPKEYERV